MKNNKVYKLKISLVDSKPLIWRQILISENITLLKLHKIIQITMGWDDSHLHGFEIKNKNYSLEYKDSDFGFLNEDNLDEKKFKIKDLALVCGEKFYYTYDFGDDWDHTILVEEILDGSDVKEPLPFCMKAVGECPFEDCGGLYGYYELLDILNNPKNKHHKELFEIYGEELELSKKRLDIDKINSNLAKIK